MGITLKMVADVRNACYIACIEGITRIPSSNLSEMSILYNFVCQNMSQIVSMACHTVSDILNDNQE